MRPPRNTNPPTQEKYLHLFFWQNFVVYSLPRLRLYDFSVISLKLRSFPWQYVLVVIRFKERYKVRTIKIIIYKRLYNVLF